MHTATSLEIAFDDVGDGGPTLLLLPGWCANRTVFRPLLAPLARHHRVLALDWRGHGGSSPVEGDVTTADLVDDAVSVLEAAGAGTVVPVALAHAGWVAIELRRRLGPDRIPAIVLLDWMVLGPPPPFLGLLEVLRDPERSPAGRSQLFEMWTTGVDLPALDAHIAEMGAYGTPMWSCAAREIGEAFARDGSPLAALAGLPEPCPTLHVYAQPADDDFLRAQEAYAGEHPWFAVRRLEASTHFPMFEVPEEIAEAVDAFVALESSGR